MNSRKFRNLRVLWLALLIPILALACTISIPDIEIEEPGAIPPTPVEAVTRVPQGEPPQTTDLLPTPTVGPTPTTIPVPEDILNEQSILTNLYARANPSVVNITVFGEQGGQLVGLGQGSGFVYDEAGNIVTNAHVVHAANTVEVTFSDGTILAGEVIGEDLYSDLAVVRVEALPEGVGPLPLGNMENLAVGQTVVAIGNPFGLEGTLTEGVISALGRQIPSLVPVGFQIPEAIQTDAAINPGNSGGPLLNLQGEVIGVNAQIETGGQTRANTGVGFAIPVSIVKAVVPDLIENGRHAWSYLGVRGDSVSPWQGEAMDLPVRKGAYIHFVEPGGPADQAGLQGSTGEETVAGHTVPVGGDVITAIDGRQVRSFADLLAYIGVETQPGQDISLTVLRDGQAVEIPLTLGERPESVEDFQQSPFTIP